jgi:hypothetical protein
VDWTVMQPILTPAKINLYLFLFLEQLDLQTLIGRESAASTFTKRTNQFNEPFIPKIIVARHLFPAL